MNSIETVAKMYSIAGDLELQATKLATCLRGLVDVRLVSDLQREAERIRRLADQKREQNLRELDERFRALRAER